MYRKSSVVNTRILILAALWRDSGAYGVDFGAKAAVIAGCSGPLIDAARIVLESRDQALIDAVVAGRIALTAAAIANRRRVRLVKSYERASPADRVAFVQAIGPTELFDTAITPALADPTTSVVTATKTKTTTVKSNGNGAHRYVRPVAPPVIVNVSTH